MPISESELLPVIQDDREAAADNRFYIDCEFDGHGGPLLSIAMVREDGESVYVTTIDGEARDPWVIANVVPLLHLSDMPIEQSCFTDNVGAVLRRFIGGVERPVIIADSPVDIGRFCAAISTSPDGGLASADYPQMTFEVHNVDCYPTDLPGAVQHNAWWDAMALRHKLAALRLRHSTDFERGLEAGAKARELLAAEYEHGGNEGPYPTYAEMARSGRGAFTQCSLRAIEKALALIPPVKP